MAHSRSEGARQPEAGERDLGTMSSELPLPHSGGTHLYVSLAGFTYVSATWTCPPRGRRGRLEHLATPRAILRGHIESQLGYFIIDDGILATITARGLARSVCSPTLRGAPLWAGTLTQVMLFSGSKARLAAYRSASGRWWSSPGKRPRRQREAGSALATLL